MIISFYSYKGGVGRSQLCANTAAYLCYVKNKKVLLWDWDFEAPGLHYFFDKTNKDIKNIGTIELLESYSSLMRTSTSDITEGDYPFFHKDSILSLKKSKKEGKIDLIPGGNYNENFIFKINTFNWFEFYELLDGKVYIEYLKEWIKNLGYDYVLIDSRTGINDYSGICNVQLPDTNIVIMAANEQNVSGCKQVIEQILNSEYTKKGFREPYIFPILSRINVNNPDFQKWSDRFVEEFSDLIKKLDDKVDDIFVKEIFRDFYVSKTLLEDDMRFSAGENLLITKPNQVITKGSLAEKYANIGEYLENLKEDKFIDLYAQVDFDTWSKYALHAESTNEKPKAALAYSKAKVWNKAIELGGTFDAYYAKGNESFVEGQYSNALHYYKQALSITPDSHEVLLSIGNTYNALGDFDQALQNLKQSLVIVENEAELRTQAIISNNIAQIYLSRKNYEESLFYLISSLDILRQVGDLNGISSTLTNIAQIYTSRKDYDFALSYLEQSLEVFHEIGDTKPVSSTLNSIAQIHASRKDYEFALSYLQDNLEVLQRTGELKGQLIVLNNMIQICELTQNNEMALEYLQGSLSIHKQLGDRNGENKILEKITQLRLQRPSNKVNEARLIILGEGNSGKTTLKDKLIDRHAAMPEPDATTRGIDIQPIIFKNMDGENFTIQVWDFGGQNIQKYAHQFFMSDSAVYAVLSNTREQNQNFQYWLNIIELLGKDSPFFIIQNEKGGHDEPFKDISQIQQRFPQTFKGVFKVNLKEAATDPRFEILAQSLFYAATQLPHTQKEYLASFIKVRKKLEILSATEQTIPFKQFKQLCKAEGIEDSELMNDYARTFTLLGIALHFEDDIHLSSQVFLRPKWITDALFAVLYADIVEHQQGKFSAADAKRIWQAEIYDNMHGVLLQLMVKFHLCYAIPHTTDYIVPQRLPTRTIEDAFVPPPDATHLLYRYKFLPSGLLTQLTCRLYERIEGAKVWNDAVQFSTKNGQGHVFVRENSADNQLELFGFGKDKADLINTVLEYMDEIHQNSKFGNLKVEKLVPCPCAVCASKRAEQHDAFFFEYDILIQDLREGETESDKCKFSRKRSPIRTILKTADIRLFNIDKIKDLLAGDKVEEALKILRGFFGNDNDVISKIYRLARFNKDNSNGELTPDEANKQKNKLINDILTLLKSYENEG